jgi:hypothetical protein
LPLIGGGGNNLESILFISPVADLSDPVSLLQDAGTDLHLLLKMQNCRFTSQDAGITVLSTGAGMLTHLPFRSPDPLSKLQDPITRGWPECIQAVASTALLTKKVEKSPLGET